VTEANFKCPYCQFEIPQTAIVCGHCTRDISLIKPLWAQYTELASEIASLKSHVEHLKIKGAQSLPTAEENLTGSTSATNKTSALSTINKKSGLASYLAFAITLLLSTTLLVFLHWLLLFVYDTNLLFLLILTVIFPLIVGAFIFRKIQLHWLVSLVGALTLGIASVFGMLAITSQLDNVPFLPENVREWREVGEYVFAIFSAFMTGLLIENWRISHQANLKKRISFSLLIEKDESGQFKASEWTNQIQSLFTAAAPFISAGTAIVSGVRVFTG
jgi:hypothetical protein